ncbi:prostaglandin F2 receptor negative regulator [Cyprinodon tularosa]|uniref:prostaglandin F2 receptor negative regulator n=1 Tax=Cyprinodon tularosa TaxID=77115 RepID=UPI0018E20549|nr:prostaglandin F2 receptor negative regulator [Cyprinodon tularosa]
MDPRFLSLAFGLFLIGGGAARVVTVSPGPLTRVEGQPVSIRCDVRDYGGPSEQDFEWEVSREAGGATVKMISTFDSAFSDASFSKRIASGDISVQRLEDNVAELKIGEVKARDAGVYICRTPSTDSIISGNYEAQVQLRVIPNTLKVYPETLPSSVPEGSELTLSCNVSRELTYPTYLSVSWLMKKGATSEEILTFGPQGDVTTGSKYSSRYLDGGVRLVNGRNGVFSLVISRVTVSDQGTYECNGTEWTHESGGKWTRIVASVKEMGTVTVTPTSHSLTVRASSTSTSSPSLLLSPGNTLSLFCNIFADNLAAISLEVTWLADNSTIISMDHSGLVISNTSSNGARAGRGEASLERIGKGEYRLGVRGVTGKDGGNYICRVRAFIEEEGPSTGGGRKWRKVAEKISNPVTVKVSEIKPNFTLTLEASVKPQKTGEPIELSCDVTNISKLPPGGRLGVSWEHTSLPDKGANTPPPKLIGSLDGYGNLLSDSTYKNRLDSGALGLSRVPPDTFKLRFLRTQKIDMGQYVCIVTAWSVSSQGDVVNVTKVKSSPLTLRWDTKSPTLNIVAKPIRKASVGGATFEMNCTVYPQNLGDWIGYAVYIKSQEGLESSVKTIMSLSPDNVVQHSNPNRRDSLVLSKTGATEFQFRLAGVQLSDRGYYWCDVTAFTKQHPEQSWTTAAKSESNKIEIDFQENGPSFSIAIHSDATSVYPWETAKMECSISVSGSSTRTGAALGQKEELEYEVRWFFTRFRGDQVMSEVASVGRNGVMKKTSRNSSSDVSIERKNSNTYQLNIYGTQDTDGGEYQCMVTPWYNSASSGLWTQAGELTSGKVFLSVRIAVAESLKLPLLYGAAASLGVGIFSLLLGLICAQCCCRNTAHTPRSRNKLLDLEMD